VTLAETAAEAGARLGQLPEAEERFAETMRARITFDKVAAGQLLSLLLGDPNASDFWSSEAPRHVAPRTRAPE
jgi:hypothetical protein